MINIKKSLAESSIANKDMTILIDSEGYVLQNKVLDWMKGALSLFLRGETSRKEGKNIIYMLTIEEFKYDVMFSESGPALTLLVQVVDQKNTENEPIDFDMDWVLSFPFDENSWPAQREFPDHMPEINWFAVPKPDKSLQMTQGKRNDNRMFISAFPIIERELIRNQGKMKEVIRLFKKMRDNKNLKHLKSFHIKTMFMLYNDYLITNKTREERRKFWRQPIRDIFIRVSIQDIVIKLYTKLNYYN